MRTFATIIGGLLSLIGSTAPPDAPSIAITHATVIDATGAPARADMTVLIRGNRIASIAPAGSAEIPAGATLVEGRGKYLIPGLWDMHTHVIEGADIDFPLLLSYGVTGIRNMHNGSLQDGVKLRAQVESGALLGPHVSLSGPLVDGASYWPTAIKVSTPAQARQAVDTLKAGGADFVKVYTFLSRDTYFAIVDEARRQRISFVGHVPTNVRAQEASAAGQRSIEHLDRVLIDCSSLGTTMDDRFNRAQDLWTQPATAVQGQQMMMAVRRAMIDSYDPKRCAALFGEFVRNGTWQVPTLVAYDTGASRDDAAVRQNPALAYVPAGQLDQWRKMAPAPADWTESQRALFRKTSELAGAANRAGVRIMAGTDVGNAWMVPGDSLHRELELLVAAGLTPMQALQAATRNPAEFLARSNDLGTVQPGKIADLVLLDANPLDDIRNTRSIRAVFSRGRYLDRAALDRLREAVARKAAAPPDGPGRRLSPPRKTPS